MEYDIKNKALKQGSARVKSDDSAQDLKNIPFSLLFDSNGDYTNVTTKIKAVPCMYLKIRELEFRDVRWTQGSFVTEDAAASNKDLNYLVSNKDLSGDPNVYYEVSDVGIEPKVRQIDYLNFDYNFQLNLHFDEIVKYEDSSKIQIDELFTYLGALFGFLVLAQKMIIYCFVRPRYEAFVKHNITDPADFRARTNFIELYRVHKFCEKQDMSLEDKP